MSSNKYGLLVGLFVCAPSLPLFTFVFPLFCLRRGRRRNIQREKDGPLTFLVRLSPSREPLRVPLDLVGLGQPDASSSERTLAVIARTSLQKWLPLNDSNSLLLFIALK